MQTNQSKSFRSVMFFITCILVVIAWYAVWKKQTQPVVEQRILYGNTMGTRYNIRLFGTVNDRELQILYQQIEEKLAQINQSMSPYITDSEISRFNQLDSTNRTPVSKGFHQVLSLALRVARATDGAFDPTIARLVNLWGFGPEQGITNAPDAKEIHQAQTLCGWNLITLNDDGIAKAKPAAELDLSAIAKGYGVDQIANLLSDSGLTNFVVEIGGETRASGYKPNGSAWRIGIQKPHYHAIPGDKLIGVITGTDIAVATSGDYQNFFSDGEGRIYSHIIDPRTGYPAGHATASVTVAAKTCAIADAFATALYVMGPAEGLEFAEQNPEIDVLFVIRESSSTFRTVTSSGFNAKTGFSPSPSHIKSSPQS